MNFLKSKSYFFLFAIVVIVGGLTAYFRLNYINPASQGPSNSLGTIESLIGKAKIHPNNKTNWTDLHVYQKLHNKDKIVTLSKERASFKISGKHLFELEEKTSIQLGEQKNRELTVDIHNGQFKISNLSDAIIHINTINKSTYKLSKKEDQVCIIIKNKIPSLTCHISNGKNLLKESKDVLKNAALERKDEKAKTVTITKKDQSQKTLKAAPKPTQQNYAGKITNLPRNNITLWTQKNLLNTNLALEMQVSPPELEGGQKLASWIPYIKTINPTNKKNSRLFKGQNAFQKQTISIPTSQVLTLAAKNNKNGIINWNFQIKGGAIASYDPSSNPREYIENTVYNYKLISLLNIEDYPLEIGLNTLNNTINNSIWFTQKLKIPANQAKYYINIYDKSSIVSIIPYLKNGMFSLRSINIPQNYGIYAAKNLKIIASLKGLIDKNSAKIIKKMLNADVIFEGDPNAILNASGKSVEDLKSWIDSPTNTNNKIYIMNGGALVQVSKNFIKNRSQVLRFIGRNASYIFSKKVNILDTKN